MNEDSNANKKNFVQLKIHLADEESKDLDAAKAYLSEEGINVERSITDGIKRIKQLHMKMNAEKTMQDMANAEQARQKAIAWVDSLLEEKGISLINLIRDEQVVMNFRGLEELSDEDMKNLLIKHFMLKFGKDSNNI